MGKRECAAAGSTPLTEKLLDVPAKHLARVLAQLQKPRRCRHAPVHSHFHPWNKLSVGAQMRERGDEERV